MADDGRLARTVRAGLANLQRLPKERFGGLGLQRQFGQVVAVNVEVTVRLVEQPAASQELDVSGGNLIELQGAVGFQGGIAAEQQPIDVELLLTVVDRQHHFVVVAQQRHQVALRLQAQQPLDHAAAVGAAVDVVAQQHQRIDRLRPDRRQQRFQRGQAAVDVADGDRARHSSHNSSVKGRKNHYNLTHGVT